MKRRNRKVYREQELLLEQAANVMTAALQLLEEQQLEINRLRAALNAVETVANVVLDGGKVSDVVEGNGIGEPFTPVETW